MNAKIILIKYFTNGNAEKVRPECHCKPKNNSHVVDN